MMRPGDLAGDYIVEREIGRGGMGIVYRARHRADGGLVAVKVLLPELINHPHLVRRFIREIDAVRSVEHPNVVRYVTAGLIAIGRPFVAFELLDGVSLQSLAGRRGAVETACVVEIVAQVANGLDAVHARGVIHRDLSPANIIVARQQVGHAQAKIIDFGVAKLRDSVVGLSSENFDLGSPSFRAPEQERESSSVDERADIYALAATAFVLLSGGLLPWGRGAIAEVLQRKALDPTPDLRAVFPYLTVEQADALRVAMARDPMKRWSTATQFARELRRASSVGAPPPDQLDRLLGPCDQAASLASSS